MSASDVIWPSVRAHGDPMAAFIIRAIDQEAADAGGAQVIFWRVRAGKRGRGR
jgi:hypothetical protein